MAGDETKKTGAGEGAADRGDLAIGFGVVIPARELVERVSRSSGPGGQGGDKVSSRVSLAWNVARSGAIDDDIRARLRERLAARLTARGELVVHAQASREQARNRAAARRRLVQIVREALIPPPRPRRATKPSRGSVERRLGDKRRRSETKRTRRPAQRDDD